MGLYIEIPGAPMSSAAREEWLEAAGFELRGEPVTFQSYLDAGTLPVCLIDNGPYKAAGVVYSQAELERFVRGTAGRPARWFSVPIDKLRAVTHDLDGWLAE